VPPAYDRRIADAAVGAVAAFEACDRDLARWRAEALPAAVRALLAPLDAAGFVAFVRDHPRYGFVVGEVAERACAKPDELAALVAEELLVALVEDWDFANA
jgi:hypothetical protein